ncbi:threonylcarbamoyl-AMP synthase [Candidatus Kaiserbacteria bacterium CG10_big_fil_rev_8_21_14_0_10_59_10]|uniref:L-threonylcarbamoyladenylate synthase n=1 Tax=Candidatus Kaiserbacteria bacterium CG10_big_fil_rev_8_21_14_0_10_59_10 TaxID=1974612 RepID=A0A2H0U818_9BACT|nr:MAG: threonylcarbamoyl-AMP synthase [Candidatus Kaiserbacteria bacterium CG10_big_fil_rev_8_21_14_0_10_59_10]
MHTCSIKKDGVAACVARAAEVLRRGGVIVYPTDTIYGLGADALSDEAVARVRQIKGRSEHKPIHAIVADLAMAEQYAVVNKPARALVKKFLPGPLTLVLKKKASVHTGIARGLGTFGIRIPDNAFCLELARVFKRPYTTTSANASGMEPPLTLAGIRAQLGQGADMVDLYIDDGELPARRPSTVVDVTDDAPMVLREGAIAASLIESEQV